MNEDQTPLRPKPDKAGDLAEAPYNPRVITDAQLGRLGKALERFGDLGGIVFNRRTGNLVGGHQRVKKFGPEAQIVIEKLYGEPTPAGTVAEGYLLSFGERYSYREVDWSETDERIANIAANQHGGEFDQAKLGPLIVQLVELNTDTDLLGLELRDLAPLVGPAWTPAPPAALSEAEKRQHRVEGEPPPKMAAPVPVTEEQRGVIEQACDKLRQEENDPLISVGRCIELICADYIAS
jgi:hypothetical protein